MHDLRAIYRDYIACLNASAWDRLGEFVSDDVTHNGRPFGVTGYRAMLENDVATIPDLRFEIELLVVDGDWVASRLAFDCHPAGDLQGVTVDGRRATFAENVFYRFRDGRIADVRSVVAPPDVASQT